MKKKDLKLILFIIIAGLFSFLILSLKPKDIPEPQDVKEENKEENKEEHNESIVEETTFLNNFNSSYEINEDLKNTIVEFFDTYYKTMKELKMYDMSYLFKNPNGEQALINKTAVSLIVDIRSLKDNDLTLKKAKYDLTIKDYSIDNDIIKINILEDSYINFNFMSEITSSIYNIKNEFVFEKIDDEYKIVSYNKVQDFFVMITDRYKSGGKDTLDSIKNSYLELTKTKIENDKKAYEDFINGNYETKVCDHEYDREKALNYALKWVRERNPEWRKYDANCQNYASQVLYTGGIPMDYFGDVTVQWKSYSGAYNTSQTPNGLAYSWTSVPYFRDYALNNKGYGLCATVDANIYTALAGDLFQVGSKSSTRHVVVSIGPYMKDNKVVDILVNSNTVDLENFPMSAYVYPYVSLIKIYGWND